MTTIDATTQVDATTPVDTAQSAAPRRSRPTDARRRRPEPRGPESRGPEQRSPEQRGPEPGGPEPRFPESGSPGSGFSESGGSGSGGQEPPLSPVTGILDIRNNRGYLRTSGYLPDPDDVPVSAAQIRQYGLRRGDTVTGAIRPGRDENRRDDSREENRRDGGRDDRRRNGSRDENRRDNGRNDRQGGLLRLDTVNGMDPGQARRRPDFYQLTPLHPRERLLLETEPRVLTTRVIDLIMPIGKGQRALIVSPPKAGKTMVLQAIANAIAQNNPECHLMAVLVDERPEEVTDMQRSVKGEVIASPFDRPPSDHTALAELAIERAKRLVELGRDVVVLLDSITRLGRAYNNAAPASGRILSGGIDASALYPPKRILGAARNLEEGGSLTIIATAMVDTGSLGDTVIFEECKSTGNAELRLDRRTAERRVFPAIDLEPSGTRREEILLPPDELTVVQRLRRALHSTDSQHALDQLLDQLRKTHNNTEFLVRLSRSTVVSGSAAAAADAA